MRHRNAPPRRLHSAREGAADNWTPAQLNGVTLWLRADDVVLNGATVSLWNDHLGSGYNMQQGTAAAQPLWSASDANFGGRASVTFDGVDDILNVSTFNTLNLFGASTFHMFSVARVMATPATARQFFSDGGTYVGLAYNTSNQAGPHNNDGSSDLAYCNVTLGQAFALSGRHSGGTLYGRVGGGAETSAASGNTAFLGNSWTMGADGGGTRFMNCAIAEIVVCNQDNASQYANWQAYVQGRYGIT